MYRDGVAILDIAAYVADYDVNLINKILDLYVPHLE